MMSWGLKEKGNETRLHCGDVGSSVSECGPILHSQKKVQKGPIKVQMLVTGVVPEGTKADTITYPFLRRKKKNVIDIFSCALLTVYNNNYYNNNIILIIIQMIK